MRPSRTARMIPVLMVVCFLTLPAPAQYSGGTGEPNDPYQIATAADLIALGETPDDYDKHFILTADIDLDPNLPGGRVFDKAVIAPDTNPNDYPYEFRGEKTAGHPEHDPSRQAIPEGSGRESGGRGCRPAETRPK